jgi:hypothetical protein
MWGFFLVVLPGATLVPGREMRVAAVWIRYMAQERAMANSAEGIVLNAIGALAAGCVYPDIAPDNSGRPYITFQAVGGQSPNFLDGKADIQNTRMQINVWANARMEAIDLVKNVGQLLTGAPVNGVPISAPVSSYDPVAKLYGSKQEFSIWYYP